MTARYVIMLGAPGAGKGTQAKGLSEALGLPHISSGDLFRHHLSKQTELGQLAQKYMDRGELVPDDVTIGMVRERLSRDDCVKGAILDGFPRTAAQASALDKLADDLQGSVDTVLYLEVPTQTLIERLAGRWMCRQEGHVFHALYNPPVVAGICDIDGSALYQRKDDQRETVERRIRVYLDQTAPLIEYYRSRGILQTVDGAGTIEAIQKALIDALLNETTE